MPYAPAEPLVDPLRGVEGDEREPAGAHRELVHHHVHLRDSTHVTEETMGVKKTCKRLT